jgi:hypothetical protein
MPTVGEHMVSRRLPALDRGPLLWVDVRRPAGAGALRDRHIDQELGHRARRAVLIGRPRRRSTSTNPTTPTTGQGSVSILKEPAMQIGKKQQEFEILPTEEDQQPLAAPPPEPQQQPEDAPA